ncbi:MAG: hypothetical protein MJ144_01270 [Clostridia bacterium]|nr:hypothetical protein [Clostridia bacterium]
MKKSLFVLLVLIVVLSMMLLALDGCGQSEPNDSIVKYLPEDEGCQKLIRTD